MNYEENELSIDDIVRIFKNQWKLILIPSFAALIITIIVISFQPKTYSSYSLIRIGNEGGRPFETVINIEEIMNSKPIQEKILNSLDSKKFKLPKNYIKYEDIDGLLKINTFAYNPKDAFNLAQIATSILMERHNKIYMRSKDKLKSLASSTQKIQNSILFPSQIISNFIIEQSIIEVSPFLDEKPLNSLIIKAGPLVFFIIFIINSLIAFYIEGRKGKNK